MRPARRSRLSTSWLIRWIRVSTSPETAERTNASGTCSRSTRTVARERNIGGSAATRPSETARTATKTVRPSHFRRPQISPARVNPEPVCPGTVCMS